MTDWRQIQARIRKAKNSSDPPLKLSELFQRTRDAMVAWELGAAEEKASRIEEAVKWYAIAAQRFRRAEWKKKAEEALARLGVAAQAPDAGVNEEEAGVEQAVRDFDQAPMARLEETILPPAVGEIVEMSVSDISSAPQARGAGSAPSGIGKRKRRRGRRGGRGRHHAGAPSSSAPSPATQPFAESIESQTPQPPSPEARFAGRSAPGSRVAEMPRSYPVETQEPQLPSERTAHGRAGDPALASRMAQLESMLRRLVASPLHRLDDADQAPAGPGVLLLSDSDQITSYYVEACQTLRVGVANLLRGKRSARNPRGRNTSESGGLQEKLAEHLGIGESKVVQYMKNHCVIRWIQLDDDAPHLAHFAIGVLRTPLNLE